MRLGYLVPEFPGQTHAFFWREVAALRARGAEVVLISTRDPGPNACAHSFAQGARSETQYLFPPTISGGLKGLSERLLGSGVRDYFAGVAERGGLTPLRQAGFVASAVELLRLARKRGLDHVHVHSCANAAHVAAVAKLLGGPNYSLTLHGDLEVYGSSHAQKFAHASFVSVVTRALQNQVQERLGLEAAFLPVIRMGVDVSSFVPTERPTGSVFRGITVARLNQAKGHVFALEAVRLLRAEGFALRYDIAGTGPEEAAIRQHIVRLGLEADVTLLGGLGEDEVRAQLIDSDAFLLTSIGLGEAAPVSVMEAMASGRAVICSRIGGTTEMIEDGQDGLLVPQRDVAAIAEALRRLLQSAEERRAIGERARAKAVAEFDANVNAGRLLDCIERSRQGPLRAVA